MPVPEAACSPQAYWNHAAESYDQDFAGTLIGKTRRDAVWCELDRVFSTGQRILELSCGTGIDAVHLGTRGIHVLGCDISPRMIDRARELRESKNLERFVDFQVLPTEQLGQIQEAPFDGAFSNFSGLNCVEDLDSVRENLARLVKPGAPVILNVMGRFVPWEVLWFLAHGDLKRAMRRCKFRDAFPLNTGDLQVHVRSVREMSRVLSPDFRLKRWKGIGISVPPSYLESWATRFSRITLGLAELDRALGHLPLIRSLSDCVVLEFARTKSPGRA